MAGLDAVETTTARMFVCTNTSDEAGLRQIATRSPLVTSSRKPSLKGRSTQPFCAFSFFLQSVVAAHQRRALGAPVHSEPTPRCGFLNRPTPSVSTAVCLYDNSQTVSVNTAFVKVL